MLKKCRKSLLGEPRRVFCCPQRGGTVVDGSKAISVGERDCKTLSAGRPHPLSH